MGDHIDKFTATPATGTNAATYGDNPWRIYVANLQERYKALNALAKTLPDSSVTGLALWHGMGYGVNFAAALASAKANYAPVAEVPVSTPLRQHSKVAFWSNYYSKGTPGEYGSTPYGTQQVTIIDGYYLQITLSNNQYLVTNLTVVNSNFPTLSTNYAVTINTNYTVYDPSAAAGNYYEGTGGFFWLNGGTDYMLWYGPGRDFWQIDCRNAAPFTPAWRKAGFDPEGLYAPGKETSGEIYMTRMTNGGTTNYYATITLIQNPADVVGTYVPDPLAPTPHWRLSGLTNRFLSIGSSGKIFYYTHPFGGHYVHWGIYSNNGNETITYWPEEWAVGVLDAARIIVTNAVAQPSCAGSFVYNENGTWASTNGFYIFYTAAVSNYVIYPSLTFDSAQPYFVNSTPEGTYVAVNHLGTASATGTNEYRPGPNTGSGRFDEPYPTAWRDAGFGGPFLWTGPGGWYAICTNANYYITTNLDTLSPAWTRAGDSPEGSYTVVGTGLYGTASGHVVQMSHTIWTNIWMTNTWVTNDVTNTIFYQCWLTKVGWSNSVYASSNIEHQASLYVYSVAPDIAINNFFHNEGLGWSEKTWSRAGVGGWGWDTNATLWIGGVLSEYPADTTSPTSPNESTCTGFLVTGRRCLLDWRFLYAK